VHLRERREPDRSPEAEHHERPSRSCASSA
jgi:hypothetical protein